MAQQGIAGTVQQRADLEEQIPASELREFMQEMREFRGEMREFKAGVVRVLDSIQDDMKILVDDVGAIRKDLKK